MVIEAYILIFHPLGLKILIACLGDGRKNAKHISSVVTQAPYFDGYQWRKYGQKWISKAKHSRYVGKKAFALMYAFTMFYIGFTIMCFDLSFLS